MKTLKTIMIVVFAFSFGLTNAQHNRNAKENLDNRIAVVTGKQQLQKDINQLRSFEQKISAFEDAFISHNSKRVKV